MVGHYVGYTGNAAIGVSWQIILVVIVFISSLFTGMAVLVARFAGANEPDKVNRVVYQAFLTAVALSARPGAGRLLRRRRRCSTSSMRRPRCSARRCRSCAAMFIGIIGMMMFFMLSGAFRAAGDARTPLRLGVAMTVLNGHASTSS